MTSEKGRVNINAHVDHRSQIHEEHSFVDIHIHLMCMCPNTFALILGVFYISLFLLCVSRSFFFRGGLGAPKRTEMHR